LSKLFVEIFWLSPFAAGGELMQSSRENLANRLEQRIPEILQRWEAKTRSSLSATRCLGQSTLLNSLPQFLNELVSTFASDGNAESVATRVSKKHGSQQAEIPSYSLEQIIQEYSLLRSSMVEVLADVDIAAADLVMLHGAIDAAIREASIVFTARHASALQESEERFRLLLTRQ
jgi:hypothetical protein